MARRSLLQFAESLKGHQSQRAVRAALDTWFREVNRAKWRSPADVKRDYGAASIVGGNRVVFNIKGNDYRLVTGINSRTQVVFIKWIGTHQDYDKIDARTINYGD